MDHCVSSFLSTLRNRSNCAQIENLRNHARREPVRHERGERGDVNEAKKISRDGKNPTDATDRPPPPAQPKWSDWSDWKHIFSFGSERSSFLDHREGWRVREAVVYRTKHIRLIDTGYGNGNATPEQNQNDSCYFRSKWWRRIRCLPTITTILNLSFD